MMLSLTIILLLLQECFADYSCICNYAVENKVYPERNTTYTPVGMLYEFDCKQVLDMNVVHGWVAIAYAHRVGYVKDGDDIQMQICQGLPSDMDTVYSTTIKTTTIQTTLTTNPTTTTLPSTRPPTTRRSTSTVISSTTQRLTAAHLNQNTTTRIPLTKTTNPPSSTSSQPTTAFFSTTRRTLTLRPVVSGNINLCPSILHRFTLEDSAALTQYGDKCYELVPIRTTWSKALGDCRAKGGTLFTIPDQQFQDYIYTWIKSYNFDHAVWTGLTDLLQEERFEWASGARVTYTNWYKDRFGNLASHHVEDCVLLVPYSPYFGKWDDAHCGETNLFGDSGQTSPFICEFFIQTLPGGVVG